MRIEEVGKDGNRIQIELDENEASHLLTFLFHAKFSEDVKLEIVGSPTMRALIEGLLEVEKRLKREGAESDWEVLEEGGVQAPAVFLKIESRLRELVNENEFENALSNYLYPYVWRNDPNKDRFVMPGTRVRMPSVGGSGRFESRYGIVVDCRMNEASQRFECSVVELDSSGGQNPELNVHKLLATDLAVI